MRRFFLISLILLFIFTVYNLQAEEPRITIGNVINISVLGHSELSKTVVVRQDGTIEYPLLSNVPVFGMTETELRDLLYPILARYVERPQLFIFISDYLMVQFRVQGWVKAPGPYTVEGPVDLLRAITIAGGTLEESDLENITIMRRENEIESKITVNMYQFLYMQDPKVTFPEIKSGDIVVVPMMNVTSYVRVMGSVHSPGNYTPVQGGNLADFINLAGGVTTSGNLNNVVHITRSGNGFSTHKLKIKKLMKNGQTELIPPVKSGDVIIVNEYNQWQKSEFWVSILRDGAYIASAIAILYRL